MRYYLIGAYIFNICNRDKNGLRKKRVSMFYTNCLMSINHAHLISGVLIFRHSLVKFFHCAIECCCKVCVYFLKKHFEISMFGF